MGVQASRTLPQIEHRQLPSLSRSLLALSRLPLLGRPLSRPSRSLPWHGPLPWQMASILRRKQARGAVSSGTRKWKQQMQQQLPLRQQQIKPRLLRSLMLLSSQMQRRQDLLGQPMSRTSAALHTSEHQRYQSLLRTLM